jgi:membrane-associated phospholipid phosphatase
MQSQTLANLISLSALFVPVAGAVWTGSWALLIGLIGANAAVAGLKRLIGGSGVWGRPAGARGCGALCDGGAVGGEPGFPSGHMTTVTMFVTVMWLWISEWWVLAAGGVWATAVAWSRWVKRCHSVLQIVGGTAFGVGCGVLFVRFLGPK